MPPSPAAAPCLRGLAARVTPRALARAAGRPAAPHSDLPRLQTFVDPGTRANARGSRCDLLPPVPELPARGLLGACLVATLLLAGCATPPPAPVPAPVEVVPAPPPPPPAQSPAARQLLLRADAQIAANHLTTPAGDNALETLAQALALEPDQPDTARAVFRGRERIAESYLALAEQALQRRERSQAERLLERAEAVDGAHLGIAPMRERLRMAARERVRSVVLQTAEVTARSESLGVELQRLGVDAKRGSGRVLIRARSDADGRWIYEQLNRAPGGRLRAEIRRAGSAGLEITTWEAGAAPAQQAAGTQDSLPMSTGSTAEVLMSAPAPDGIPVDVIPSHAATAHQPMPPGAAAGTAAADHASRETPPSITPPSITPPSSISPSADLPCTPNC